MKLVPSPSSRIPTSTRPKLPIGRIVPAQRTHSQPCSAKSIQTTAHGNCLMALQGARSVTRIHRRPANLSGNPPARNYSEHADNLGTKAGNIPHSEQGSPNRMGKDSRQEGKIPGGIGKHSRCFAPKLLSANVLRVVVSLLRTLLRGILRLSCHLGQRRDSSQVTVNVELRLRRGGVLVPCCLKFGLCKIDQTS